VTGRVTRVRHANLLLIHVSLIMIRSAIIVL
jgi:hypothetical protein